MSETREIDSTGAVICTIESGLEEEGVQHAFVIGNTAYYSCRNGRVFKIDLAEKVPHTELISFEVFVIEEDIGACCLY